MIVPTKSGTPLQPHGVTYVAPMYPDVCLPHVMNARLNETMYREAEHSNM